MGGILASLSRNGRCCVPFDLHKCTLHRVLDVGISTASTGSRERHEGSLAQHDSAGGGTNSGSLTPGGSFKAYLSTAQLDENHSDE